MKGDWPFSKYIVLKPSKEGSINVQIPEYYLVLNSAPCSLDDFFVPFISRLLDYRWRFNEFLLFHYQGSDKKLQILDFLAGVKFRLNYQFIEDKISDSLHEVTSEEGIEEYLNEIKKVLSKFIERFESKVSLNVKLDKTQACELTLKIFLLAKLIPADKKELFKEILFNGYSKGVIKFNGPQAMLVAFFRILHKRGLIDPRHKDVSKFIEDNFLNKEGKTFGHQSILNALNSEGDNYWNLEKLKQKLILLAEPNSGIVSDLEELFSSDRDL